MAMANCSLTGRQAEVLEYIREFIDSNGYPPSGRELAKACKLGSASGAHRMVSTLVRKGFLEHIPGRSRGLSIAPAHVDYSRMERSDLIRLRTMAAQHAVIRDAELIVAATHRDEVVKEQIVSDALERTRRVVTLNEVLSGLLPGIDVSAHVRPLRDVLASEDHAWLTFVIDALVINRISAAMCDALAEASPEQRAVIWPDQCLFGTAAEQAESWLQTTLGDAATIDLMEQWTSRSSELLEAMFQMTDSIDREFQPGRLSVAYGRDVLVSMPDPRCSSGSCIAPVPS